MVVWFVGGRCRLPVRLRTMTWTMRHLTQSIDADIQTVIDIAGDPRQLPRWAAGLGAGIRNQEERWITDIPRGALEVKFVGPKEWGILDHDVIFPDGTVLNFLIRVLRNDQGSEVVFSVVKRDKMTDEEFESEAALVSADLARLKSIVEAS